MGDLVPLQKTWKETKSIVYVVLIVVLVVLLAAVILVVKLGTFFNGNICNSKECIATSYILLNLIDPSADPCDNFYKFTCGNYMGNTLIGDLQSTIDREFKHLITDPIEEEDARSIRTQKKYYQSCMNLTAIDEDQNETLKKLLRTVTEWPMFTGGRWNETDFDWGKVVDQCRSTGLYYDWFIDLHATEKRLYVSPPSNVNQFEGALKNRYIELMANVVSLLGAPGNIPDISKTMGNVVRFEMELSKIINESQANASDTEYTIFDIIDNKFPSIPWSLILRHGELPRKIMFNEDGYVQKLGQLLNKTNKRVQADYILWKLIESYSQFLTQNVRNKFETFADLSKSYKYRKHREDYCFRLTTSDFAWVAEAEYVRRYASQRQSVQNIVEHIKAVLHDHIDKVTWMERDDKNVMFRKLENLSTSIGGPDEMYDKTEFEKLLGFDQIDISGLTNPIEIICQVKKSRDLLATDYKKHERINVELATFHQVLNLAFIKYLPDENIMFLPAAALSGLLFSQGRPDYLNYGAIGSVIGHELTHGFGMMGSSVYVDENEVLLWSNETRKNFFAAAGCLLERCNDIGIENNTTMDCNATFEENFADHAGITLSYEAYRNFQQKEEERTLPALPYTSSQLFWIIYASLLCDNTHINSTDKLTHMLSQQRIVGSFRNTEYFARDFRCPVGSNMNPAEKCKIL